MCIRDRLPTHQDVLKHCFKESYNLALETSNKCVSFSKVSATVAQKVKSVFDKALIPTVSEYRTVQLINAYYDSHYKLRKSYNHGKDKATFKVKIKEFKQKSSSLLMSQHLNAISLWTATAIKPLICVCALH